MNSICIIGQGNVATHLCVALFGKVDELLQVNSRTLDDLPLDCDCYILAVSDDAIASVAARLPRLSGIVAHTSGSKPLEVLTPYADRCGVVYPLMTFSKEADLDYSLIPFFIEGSSDDVVAELTSLASQISDRVCVMDSATRLKMHVASVFACNFTNYLWSATYGLLQQADVPFQYILPLIDATTEKIHHLTPRNAQTGPAKRGDTSVINAHLNALASSPQLQELYRLLTEAIAADQSTSPKHPDNECN